MRHASFRLRTISWSILAGAGLALTAVGLLQVLHADLHEASEPGPATHWLRDSALALPLAFLSVWVASQPAVRRLARWLWPGRAGGPAAGVLWALVAATAFGLASVPGNEIH